MTRPYRIAVFALAVCVAATPAAATQKPGDPDLKEIASYRLTTAALAKVVNVNRAMLARMKEDPKFQEVLTLRAEIAALEKKEEPTEADESRLEALRAKEEELEDSFDNPLGGDTKSLSEMEARIRGYPPLVSALQQEGMTPREYATFWMAFIQAAFVQGFKKSGMLKELPPDVNPENVRFIEEHAAEIQAIQKEFEALDRKP